MFGFIGPIGWNELIVILVIVLVIFGPRRLPEIAEAMGKSIRIFKQATRDAEEGIRSATTATPAEKNTPPEKKND